MDDFWPKSKAIVLVFSCKIAPKSKSLFYSSEERVMKMDEFGQKVRLKSWYLHQKLPQSQNLYFAVEKKEW